MVLGELLVPLVAALLDPLAEGLADEGVDDVADVLPRHLADLSHNREALLDLWVGEAEVEDEIEREVLVLRHGDHLHLVTVDGLEAKRQ